MFPSRQIDKEHTEFGADGGDVVAPWLVSFRPSCLRVLNTGIWRINPTSDQCYTGHGELCSFDNMDIILQNNSYQFCLGTVSQTS